MLTWRSIVDELRRHRAALLQANLAAVLAVVAAVPVPLLLPLMVDEVLLHHPGRIVDAIGAWFPTSWHGPVLFIGVALLATVALRLAAIVLNVWQGRTFSLLAKEVVYRIRERMLARLSRTALSEFETVGAGRVTSHFVTDLGAIDTFLGASISGLLVSVLTLVGVAGVLFWMHWQLALFILLLNPVVILFSTRLGKRVKDLKKFENRAFEAFQDALAETLDALTQIRAMNREKHYLARVTEKAADIRRHAAAFAWKSDAMSRFSFFIFLAGFDAFRAGAMLMVVYSDLSIGEMLAVFGYLWFMMTPVQELVNMQYSWFAANAALTRINALLGLHSEARYPARENPFAGVPTVGIALEHVSFAYGEGEDVLEDVSLSVAPGEKVALVGASGGGKSTLVQALLGLYPLRVGQICYGGVPVSAIGWETVREYVGVVLQHPVLFNDTVRANLTLGRSADDATLWRALAIAQLDATVAELPQGLDTMVGRQGVRLSGGQRQRLAIARMVVAEPRIVILDEATSALDTETERRLHQALGEFLAGRTTLIIAHRLSAVRQADRILVFENGRVVEEGDHAALIDRGGLYHKLYHHA
ncbi:ABC transporter ATPase [Thiobacillus denitrificans ATCC 25259]|uniref:ABC transporter ATPase n=1 Tax=Thiobacillus denitrificans (strain ATCC 25259 / T1) TaxID=292415 RepID=Q3SF47_THIDA|nr:ABC transporter ATP-binding protein [Thiobacillus denitrificans]AAZ98769.1 ABC transporter ATPase [Thiobacillus denitrificans ATCC 25259]